jgi:hypothetical protein
MSISLANTLDTRSPVRGLLPLCVGAGAYFFFLFIGDALLQDSDTFWQIKVGQWILDHRAVPYSDLYSFTKPDAPWISTSWLSQVLYAAVHSQWGWAGPVILASLATAATAAIFVYLLSENFEAAHCVLLAMLALLLSLHHLLARPHVLAMPMMVAWVGGMISAADRRAPPSFLLLPLMVLWTNLHGGFVLGLALIAPLAWVAVWDSAPERRVFLILRWGSFAICALVASCCTPYGWNSLLGAARILDLGKLLSLISEWQPADFSSFGFFEASLLGLVGLAFYRGLVLSPPRIVLLLGLIYMALTHVRSIEAFAFLMPLVLAKPLANQIRPNAAPCAAEFWSAPYVTTFAAIAIVGAASASTMAYMSHHNFVFVNSQTPAAAVELLKQRQAKRVFNSYAFGGYLIAMGVPAFIDGRAELYGEKFVLNYFDAVEARKVDQLLRLLEDYHIDATLLVPNSPAAQVLDHIEGWQKLYADDTAVIHVRATGVQQSAPSGGSASVDDSWLKSIRSEQR